jgi:hypothetical protein
MTLWVSMFIACVACVSYIHLFIAAVHDNGHPDTPIDRYNDVLMCSLKREMFEALYYEILLIIRLLCVLIFTSSFSLYVY